MRPLFALALLLALATPALPAWSQTRCLTYQEKTLGRLQTLCEDGTGAISTYNQTLSRWESTVTPPPAYRATEVEGSSNGPDHV